MKIAVGLSVLLGGTTGSLITYLAIPTQQLGLLDLKISFVCGAAFTCIAAYLIRYINSRYHQFPSGKIHDNPSTRTTTNEEMKE